MATSQKTILVTGATGKQGGAVIDNLLAAGSGSSPHIIAVTRDATTSTAQKLASIPNVTVISGDLSDPDAIFQKAGAVWGVFSVQINSDAEERQGKALVDAAVLHGVQHFVYASADRGGPDRSEANPTNVKNLAAKFHIEKHLQQRAEKSPQQLTYTVLRPVTFFDNLTADIHGKGFARMWEQLGEKKLQFVSAKDIGWFAAQSLLHPERYRNSALSLVGDELTQPEADVIFRKVVGSAMPMIPCPIASAVKMALKDTLGDLFKWIKLDGYGGDVETCRRMKPDMEDFSTWLGENRGTFLTT